MVRTVAVIDDHTMFAELISSAVHDEPGLEVVGHAPGAAAGLAMVEELRPDVVIMDVHLGDGDGIEATAALTALHPDLLVVVLTAHADPAMVRRAAAAQACALLPKDGNLEGLFRVLRDAVRGSLVVDPALVRRLDRGPTVPRQRTVLTPREQEVLRLLATGLDTRLLAREAGMSVHTARDHVKNILAKLDAHTQLEAVAKAMRQGLIDLDSTPSP